MSSNNHDIDHIVDMVHMIYMLHRATNSSNKVAGTVTLGPEQVQKMTAVMKSNMDRIKAIKLHQTDSISLLEGMAVDMLSDMLTVQAVQASPAQASPSRGCHSCHTHGKAKPSRAPVKITPYMRYRTDVRHQCRACGDVLVPDDSLRDIAALP